jgi:hypothetical protein
MFMWMSAYVLCCKHAVGGMSMDSDGSIVYILLIAPGGGSGDISNGGGSGC